MTERVQHLGLGSNQGDRAEYLRGAVRAIRSWPGVRAVRVSPVYETEHVGPGRGDEPAYLNACIAVHGELPAEDLLPRTKQLEREAGRAPDSHLRPRPLDVDILLEGDRRVHTGSLQLPHPRLHERRFVLQPLHDLDPDLTIPGTTGSLVDLMLDPSVAGQAVRRVDVDLATATE